MVRMGMGFVVAAAWLLGASVPGAAQTSDDGWWAPLVLEAAGSDVLRDAVLGRTGNDRDRRDARVPGYDDRWDRVEPRGGNARRGNGPPFCRNGQGHPVHGWRWCQEKGWAGSSSWSRAGWPDVVIGRPGQGRGRLGEPTLGRVLGDAVLGRFQRAGRESGLKGAVDGRWIPLSSGGSVLQLRMGGVPLAELADLNRDGRADVVLLNRLR